MPPSKDSFPARSAFLTPSDWVVGAHAEAYATSEDALDVVAGAWSYGWPTVHAALAAVGKRESTQEGRSVELLVDMEVPRKKTWI